MCDINRPSILPDALPANVYLEPRVIRMPDGAWERQLAEHYTPEQAEVLRQADLDAAAIQCDVHIYRSIASPLLGISLEPGTGPRVKFWEH